MKQSRDVTKKKSCPTFDSGTEKAGKWIRSDHTGLRYRLHKTRKHGKDRDRYYSIRFRVDGVLHEQGLGWLSEGMTMDKAVKKMTELKQKAREGKEFKLKKIRAQEAERKRLQEEERVRQEKEQKTFADYFENNYLPDTAPLKTWGAVQAEQSLFKTWLQPAIGKIPLMKISQIDLERLKKTMMKAKKSSRTVHYAFSVVSQVWTRAWRDRLVSGPSPTKDVDLPKLQNERIRFLSHEEAALLLDKLKEKSVKLYRISFLSLNTGGRFSEITGLIWRDINMEAGTITFRNTKSGKDRTIFMTRGVRGMFAGMPRGVEDGLIFRDKKGEKIKSLSATFERVVNEIGLNDGVEDPRYKFTFHGLRHSAASFLVAAGVDLFRIREILGHASFRMTQRYSHVSRENLKEAMKGLEDQLKRPVKKRGEKAVEIKKGA